MGQEAAEPVDIPSMPGIRVNLVPLTEAESQAGLIRAASLDVLDNSAGIQARNRAAVESDVWNAIRDMGDATKKVWATPEEMVDELEAADVDYIFDQLTLLMEYASPSMDGLSEKDLAELKNNFALIDWNGLTGRRWSALKLCLSNLLPELLAAKFSSSTFTPSSTETTENDEST
jgi:hypothetical protein